MYTVTFYSFKGGVGRSLALVNVGAELARAGRRVLLVDFDLEAPSLMTFNLAGTDAKAKGVVDFVGEYLETGVAPNVSDFVIPSESYRNGGRLWLMSAGSRGPDYQKRLMAINWKELYEEKEGFLLFEDLKAQWQSALTPDYVLIDSRTGHSEVLGICTRQLPDAVCAVFMPNRQNLDGLTEVIRQIRAQGRNPEGREILVHYVLSNTPYHDDERGSLARSLGSYKEALEITGFDSTLHAYPHLGLLGQEVFVLEQPKTSLSEEYRALTDTIRSHNLQDVDSAIKYLRTTAAAIRARDSQTDLPSVERRLTDIEHEHGANGEVCFWLARVRRQLGSADVAALLLAQAIEAGYREPPVFLERASLRFHDSKSTESSVEAAKDDLFLALDELGKRPNYRDTSYAVRSLVTLGRADWQSMATCPAVVGLTPQEQLELVTGLDTSEAGCALSFHVLQSLLTHVALDPKLRHKVLVQFSLAGIRLVRLREVIESFGNLEPGADGMDQVTAFNLGVAHWGLSGRPDPRWFERVLGFEASDGSPDRDPNANHLQCLAISSWIMGDIRGARAGLERALMSIRRRPVAEFSAWRYLRVSPFEFASDLDDLRGVLDAPPRLPPFLSQIG